MWTLSGFADEIDDDFEKQCAVLNQLGIANIELRSAWGVNVLDLDDDQLQQAKAILRDHGIAVSSIGSPIGKIFITDDFEPHLARHDIALARAEFFGAPYIRLFSFFIPAGDDPDSHRDEVLRRMAALTARSEGRGVVLLHENEKEIYGDIPRRCVDIVESVGSPHLAPGLGRGQLRAVRSATVLRGVPVDPSASGVHADQGRAAGHRRGRPGGRGRR